MRETIIKENESGQRLDKYLKKYLPQAPGSFIYKMLRKKNITLNGKKADGSEKLKAGDEIRLFLSDETYEKFAGKQQTAKEQFPTAKLDILYEDSHVLLVNKPAGMLTQKAAYKDISLNEYVLGYLSKSGQWSPEEKAFRPSVCNRLDRNTSGIVICGKSMIGLQRMAELLQDRSLHKYYLCLIHGAMKEGQRLEGWLRKDEKSNQVEILKAPVEDAAQIITEYEPMKVSSEATLLKVKLVTGKPHQIRAHLAWQGHPLLGDPKYGDPKWNRKWNGRMKTAQTRQMLHAYELVMPEMNKTLKKLSGRTFTAPVPEDFYKIIKEITWEHGTQEVLEVQH